MVINLYGTDVSVDATARILTDGTVAFDTVASVGSTQYRSVMTVAPNPAYTQEQLQSDLDEHRRKVAIEALGREVTKNLSSQVV